MADEIKTEETKKPTTIFLEWTADCIKHIENKTFLNTGINELDVATWERVRWMVADIVVAEGTRLTDEEKKIGRIIEVGATVEAPASKGTDKPVTGAAKVKSAKTLADFGPSEAEKLVRDTNSLKTLEAWKKSESRDSVRVAILEQIDVINGVKKDK